MIDDGWQVHIADEFHIGDVARVFIYRRIGDTIEVQTPQGDGEFYVRRISAIEQPPHSFGLLIPRSALRAIAETIKPGPGAAEVARLEDALRVERGRVDSVLARLLEARS